MRSDTPKTISNMTTNSLFPLSIPATAATFSAGFLGLGAFHFLAPIQTCGFFGLPFPPFEHSRSAAATGKGCLGGQAQPWALPFIYANGGRELMLSIAFGIMGVQRDREGISALMYAISIAAQIDAYVVWAYGGVRYGGWKGRWIMHSLGGLIVGLTAWNEWFSDFSLTIGA